jgi:hypothetical protein
MIKCYKWLLFVAGICSLAACRSDSQRYEDSVARELATGIRQDSIFMGIKLGMTSKEFYAHCWKMNKKGLFFEGPGNMSVLYHFKNELKHPATMTFYPDFRENKINKMGVTFSYDAFAPWNKALFADSLQRDVFNLFKKWYKGADFLTMTDPVRGTIFVQVKGNRRIIIGKYDEQRVKVDFTDLLTENSKK